MFFSPEMGGQSCEGTRSWQEDIYWTHFQFLHFAQFLGSGYDQHLALPKTFSDHLKKKLPENVSLRGPSGIVWNIELTARDDTLYFKHGWPQFVKDHKLKENDLLVFKYNGESLFDVLIFDGGSFCEIAASYFVGKCGHTEQGDDGALGQRKGTDNTLIKEDNVDTPSNVHSNGIKVPIAGIPSSKTPSETALNAGVESATPEQVMDADTSERMTNELVSAGFNSVQTKRRGRPPANSVLTKKRGRPPKESDASKSSVVSWASDDVII